MKTRPWCALCRQPPLCILGWLKIPDSKSSRWVTASWVRLPLPPPQTQACKKKVPFYIIVTYNIHMRSLRLLKTIEKPAFSSKEAKRVGVSPRMLTYLVQRGAIERRSQGLYAFPKSKPDDLHSAIQELIAVIPTAIVSYSTALHLHDLADELPDMIELIVRYQNTPKRRLDGARLHRLRGSMRSVRTQIIDGIKVTTIEQTIIDMLRTGTPLSRLIEVFRLAQRKRLAPSLTELTKIAADFRAKGRAKVLVEALL